MDRFPEFPSIPQWADRLNDAAPLQDAQEPAPAEVVSLGDRHRAAVEMLLRGKALGALALALARRA